MIYAVTAHRTENDREWMLGCTGYTEILLPEHSITRLAEYLFENYGLETIPAVCNTLTYSGPTYITLYNLRVKFFNDADEAEFMVRISAGMEFEY